MFENILQAETARRISSAFAHSGFTDLIMFKGRLICCYRQGDSHVSRDGRVEICTLEPPLNMRIYSRLTYPGADLRDPKLCIMPDGKIVCVAYARFTINGDSTHHTVMVSWFSDNGLSWSAAHTFGPAYWWLWRLRWHKDEAFGLAYNRGHDRVDLYKGHPRKQVECLKAHVLSLQKHGLGYPNESDLYFEPGGKLWALVRRDADSFSAQLGCAYPPYTRWQWHDLKEYIGGPVMQPLCEDWMLVGGRQWTGKKLQTRLWAMQLSSHSLHPLAVLPSAGDNSYPGVVIDGDSVWVSHYSGHIDNQARVYLTRLRGVNALLDVIKQG